MTSPQETTQGLLALRASMVMNQGRWMVVVVNTPTESAVAFADEWSAVAGPIKIIDAASTISAFIDQVRETKSAAVVVRGTERFTDADWMRLDAERSLLSRTGPAVIVTDRDTLDRIEGLAPNFSSWIGADCFILFENAELLTVREVEERLNYLRSWSKLTDDDVVTRAADGKLPKEPEYAEWLVLVGRGDLVGSDGK